MCQSPNFFFFMDFSSSFASSMEESFSRINCLIESKFSAQGNVSQDATKFSFSESPPVSVRQSLGTERQDPSQSNPQQDLGSGGEPVEPVQDLGAISPELRFWVEGLRSAGVRIPQQILDLSRSARLGSGEPAEGARPFPSAAQPSEAPPVASSGLQGVFLAHRRVLGMRWVGLMILLMLVRLPVLHLLLHLGFLFPSLHLLLRRIWRSLLFWETLRSLRMLRVGSVVFLCSFVPKRLLVRRLQLPGPASSKLFFSDVTRVPKVEFAPVLFHWVAEMLSEARQLFEAAAAAGKAPHSSLPTKKQPLASSSDPVFSTASSFNPSLPCLVGNLSGNRSAGVPCMRLVV